MQNSVLYYCFSILYKCQYNRIVSQSEFKSEMQRYLLSIKKECTSFGNYSNDTINKKNFNSIMTELWLFFMCSMVCSHKDDILLLLCSSKNGFTWVPYKLMKSFIDCTIYYMISLIEFTMNILILSQWTYCSVLTSIWLLLHGMLFVCLYLMVGDVNILVFCLWIGQQ